MDRQVFLEIDTIAAYGSYLEITSRIVDFGDYEGFDQHGICWSSDYTPTIADCHIEWGAVNKSENYSYTIGHGEFDASTTYRFRPFAKKGNDVFYGEEFFYDNKYAADTWEDLNWVINTSFIERNRGTAFTLDNLSYFGLGMDNLNNDLNDIWCFDPQQNTFTQKADFIGGARNSCCSFQHGNYGFIGFGEGGGTYYGDIYRYNPAGNVWEYWKDVGYQASYMSSFVIDDYFYFGMGIKSSSFSTEFYRIHIPTCSSPETLIDFPGFPRGGHVSFSVAGRGFVGLGSKDDNVTTLNDFWMYDPGSGNWTQLDNYPGMSRFSPICFVINDIAYVGGGAETYAGMQYDFYYFDPGSVSWHQLNNIPFSGRYSSTCFSNGSFGYVLCGTSGGTGNNKKELWRFIP
ncbi:MAG: kelch repeat-containing protein [Bacteroidota bacterium]